MADAHTLDHASATIYGRSEDDAEAIEPALEDVRGGAERDYEDTLREVA